MPYEDNSWATPAKTESGLRSNSTAEPGSKQHN
ncbi:unnamed protein product [Tetraodon nigroviridis]|uniref:(spotted green pufferfish) hypothetical protein n=1 Tax=Tetraodon nigroviridis TaxID=99883 RepID=Q4SRL0_TETNG|nr:unnamed protein product [Tetraodon nigroviridis]